MTPAQLEHIIRAAGTIADVDDIKVIGSQAVLGEFDRRHHRRGVSVSALVRVRCPRCR
jgi:hypothetical protein